MADLHRAELIMVAVLALLADSSKLVITDGRAKRGRVYPNEKDTLPSLSLYMGADRQVSEPNVQYLDRVLQVKVIANTKESASTAETTINQIKLETYKAFFADRKLGLSFVHTTNLSSDGEPVLKDGTNRPEGECEMIFEVKYRHSYSDPSA